MRILKKSISFLLIAIWLCALIPTMSFAATQSNIDVVIADQVVDFINKPYKKNDVYFVPLQELCGYLNINCERSGETFTINRGSAQVELQTGNMICTVNGSAYELEAAPKKTGETVYAPLGLFTKCLEISSNEHSETDSISIYPNIYRFYISENNAAATNVASPYENTLKKESTAYDGMTFDANKPELEQRLFYKFDLSPISDKKFEKVMLNVYATRTFKEYSILRVYKTKAWGNDVSHNNMPKQEGSTKSDFSFRDDMGGTYEWRNIDITGLADSLPEDHYLYLGMTGIPPVKEYEPPIIRITSVNNRNKAYIEVYTKEIYQFPLKGEEQLNALDTNGLDELSALLKIGVIKKDAKIPQDLDAKITREEFVNFAIGLLNDSVYFSSNIDLEDVQDNNVYYKNIAIARSMNFIAGGNFRPKDMITLPEAQTVLSRMLGYEPAANQRGGYPVGYRITAQESGIMKGITGTDSSISYRQAFKMIYNALEAPMCVQNYSLEESYSVDKNETILKKCWDMYSVRGKITGNKYTNFDSTISSGANSIYIDGNEYYNKTDEYIDLLGYDVKAFCTIKDDEIVYIGINNGNVIKTIDVQDINSVIVSGTEYKINYGKSSTKTLSIKNSSTVVYNGKKIKLSDYDKEKLFNAETGTITVINDDTFIMNMYKVIVVYTADALKKQIIDRYDPLDKTIRLENVEYYSIKDKNYNNIDIEDLKENDCLSVAESLDGKLVICKFNRNPLTGSVSAISYNDNNSIDTLCVNGNVINVVNSENWAGKIALGQEGTFYRDCFGNIVGSNLGKETASSKMEIGYLLDVISKSDKLYLKILSKRSRYYVKYEAADKFYIDEKRFKDAEKAKEYLSNGGTVEKQVIQFMLNQDKQITKIDTIALGNEVNANSTLNCRYSGTSADLRYKGSGKLGDLFFIDTASTTMIRVPVDENDLSAYTLLDGGFKNDEWLQVDVYTIGNIKPNADAIVVKNYGTSASVTGRDALAVFDRVVDAYSEEEGEVQKIMTVYKNDESSTSVIVTEEKEPLLTGLKRGDLIRYNSNFENELQAVVKYYDYESKTIVNNPGYDSFNHECRVYGGISVDKVGEYVKFVNDLNETDESKFRWIRFKGISKAYKYKVEQKIEVTKATLDDIQPYEYIPFDPTGIMLMSEYEDINHVWLLEMAQPANTGIYKVSFDGAGSNSGGVSPIRKNAGEGIILPENAFVKDDYEFDGWKDESGNIYQEGDGYTVYGNQTFVAVWKYVGHQYKCTFTDGISEDANKVIRGILNKVIKIPSGDSLNDESRHFTCWQDSNGNKYFENDEFTIIGDETFTALFETYGTEKVNVSLSNAAFVVNELNFGGVNYSDIYSKSSNNIEANDGIAVLKTSNAEMYYKLDLSSLIGKDFDSVKLKISVKGEGDSWFVGKLYKTSSDTWDANEVNISNAPGCESTPFVQKTYKYSDYENIIPRNKWTYVEFDIKDALLSDDNYIIGIKIQNGDSDGKGIYVQGPTTENPPYVEVTGIKDTKILSFEGGDGATGTMPSVNATVNSKVQLPECTFVKENCDFDGWTDGTKTYSAGSEFIMPASDTVLTAQWKESQKLKIDIPTENCGFTITDTTWAGINHTMFDVSKNNIELNGGISFLRGGISYLYYKIDKSALSGKSFESAKLYLYSDRNNIGNRSPVVKIYKKSSGIWDATDASTLSAMSFEDDASISTTFQTSNSTITNTYFVDAEPRYLEFDITDLLTASGAEPLIIKVENTNRTGEGIKIYGPTSDYKPYIQFSGVNDPE